MYDKMKNSEVAEIFASSEREAKTKHLFIEKNIIYSYGYHFPLCIKLENNIFVLNSNGYSMTTAKHKGLIKRAIGDNKIILMKTEEMKDLIYNNIKSINQLAMEKLKE